MMDGWMVVVVGVARNGSPRAASKVEFPVLLTSLTTSRVTGIGNRQEV
jgi:hypothetical protein